MAKTDLTGLLTGVTQAPIDPMLGATYEQRMLARGAQAAQGLRRGMGALTGADTRTTGEKAQAMLAQLDINNPDDQPKIMEIVSRVNPERAAQLQAQIGRQRKERDQTTAFSTFVTNKYGTEFGKLAAEGVLTPDNMDDFISDLQDANNQKGGTYTVQDSEGNDYTMIPSFDKKKGKTVNTYSPITPNAPATPVGKVVITGGEFAQTAGEAAAYELKSDSDREQETTYQEQRVAMVAQMPELNAKYSNLQRAEDLLATVPTGGPVNMIGTGLETFFGKKPKDKAELEIIFGLEMLKSLKPFFGGVISDSESKRLEKIYAGLEKGSEANKGILATLKKELDNAMKKAELYRNAKTFKDFETTMGVMFPAGEVQVDSADVIDFNDLD
jgi:hypothetical protein